MKCCNPECVAPFDYREGRLIRVTCHQENDNNPHGLPMIKHFWLCGKCAAIYVFDFESDDCVGIKPREEQLSKEIHLFFSTAA